MGGTDTPWSPSPQSRVASSEDPAAADDTATSAHEDSTAGDPLSSDGVDGTDPAATTAADDGMADEAVVDEVIVVESADTVTAAGTMPATSDSAAEWSEIKAMFVDDPTASVQRASGLVERAVEGFMSALRKRQDSLGGWQEGDAGRTEELRMALRGYRSLFDQLEQMSGRYSSGQLS